MPAPTKIVDTHQHANWCGRDTNGLVADLREHHVTYAWLLTWCLGPTEEPGRHLHYFNPIHYATAPHPGMPLSDIIDAKAGNDRVCGGPGDDTIAGGNGDDRLFGEGGKDTLWGDGDDDLLYGAGNNDTLYGGTGNDKLRGGTGVDTCYGDAGTNVKKKCELPFIVPF